MGWQRSTVTLKWPEQHELHGLEIVMVRQPFGQVIDEWLTQGGEHPADFDDLTPAQQAERSLQTATGFVAQIISWNLEDLRGNPVPVSVEGLLANCDGPLISQMRIAYAEGTSRVAPPLSQSSAPGPAPAPVDEWDLAGLQELSA